MVTKFEPSSSTTENHSQNNESHQELSNNLSQSDMKTLSSDNSGEENLDVVQVSSQPESPPKPASKGSKKKLFITRFL